MMNIITKFEFENNIVSVSKKNDQLRTFMTYNEGRSGKPSKFLDLGFMMKN